MLEDCNIQILLSFCRNMFLHMRTAHTKFGSIAPTGNRVMALCYFQIYLVDRYTFRPDVYLVTDFTKIVLSPAVDFEGAIVLELSVHPSSFCPSIGLWNTES